MHVGLDTGSSSLTHVLHSSIGGCIQLYPQRISLISSAFGLPGESGNIVLCFTLWL